MVTQKSITPYPRGVVFYATLKGSALVFTPPLIRKGPMPIGQGSLGALTPLG